MHWHPGGSCYSIRRTSQPRMEGFRSLFTVIRNIRSGGSSRGHWIAVTRRAVRPYNSSSTGTEVTPTRAMVLARRSVDWLAWQSPPESPFLTHRSRKFKNYSHVSVAWSELIHRTGCVALWPKNPIGSGPRYADLQHAWFSTSRRYRNPPPFSCMNSTREVISTRRAWPDVGSTGFVVSSWRSRKAESQLRSDLPPRQSVVGLVAAEDVIVAAACRLRD